MTIFQKFTNLIKKDLKRWTTTVAEVSQEKTPRIVGYWMGGIAAMAFGAVSLGGVTRLTESGLSMVKFVICFNLYSNSLFFYHENLMLYYAPLPFIRQNSEFIY